jgi:SagB-type dehydrogenase family enzyme
MAFVLAATYGVTGRQATRWGELPLRSVGSAGSRYPLELYALVLQEGDLPKGAYHYRPEAHVLEPLRAPFDAAQVERALLFSPAVQGASIVLLVTAVWDRTLDKYGDRGYRAVLMEAGAAAHNACLAATALELGAVILEGADAVENDLVGADGFEETTLTAIAIGHKAQATGITSYDPIQGS